MLIISVALCGQDTARYAPAIRAQVETAQANARANPSDSNSAGTLGMTLQAYQQFEAAASAYSKAASLEPSKFDWTYLLATVRMSKGDFETAVSGLGSALRLHPNYLPAQLRLAESLTAIGQLDEAAELYRRVLAYHPDSAQSWYGLGRLQALARDHQAAVSSFSKACELYPNYGMAHFAFGSELRRLGRNTEAEQHLAIHRANMTVQPPLEDELMARVQYLNKSGQTYLERAAELERTCQIDAAIREHEAALESEPENVQVHINLISLYGRAGAIEKAKQRFDSAIKLNPSRSDAWHAYGLLLLKMHEDSEAEAAFRRAIAINPNDAESHAKLGSLYESHGRLSDAEHEFRDAVANRPDFPFARFHLGRLLVNKEKYQEAIQQFSKAADAGDDQSAVYLYALAATYARAGDRSNALQYFERARAAASARGASQLLSSIERDLKTLGSVQ